ncbi:DUF6941 family protein [Aquisalimonas asiatica]|uniref:DUF6941 family protein n=1 Tax=Aquisalimonas asiatica TaxID=406100 RepID=UPI000B853E25|nr:hypothetical protein [Aquisalimonas asiatica]
MVDRYAHAIFCDDVRMERGGKQTFVGVYGPSLRVDSFPATLPSFWAVVYLVSPASDPVTELKVQVKKGDEVLGEADIDGDELRGLYPSSVRERTSDAHRITANLQIQFSPLKLASDGLICVIVQTEREVFDAGHLKVQERTRVQPKEKNPGA